VIKIRKFIFYSNLILFILWTIGCQTVDNSEAKNVPRIEQEIYPVASEVVEYNNLPERLKLWIETNKLPETELVKAFSIDGKTYIVILLSKKDALNYDVQITEVYDQIAIRDNEKGSPLTSAIYQLKDMSDINNETEKNSPFTIVKIDGHTSEYIQLQRSLSTDELSDHQQNTNSQSSEVNKSKTVTTSVSGSGIAHLIPVETLTKEGKTKQ